MKKDHNKKRDIMLARKSGREMKDTIHQKINFINTAYMNILNLIRAYKHNNNKTLFI